MGFRFRLHVASLPGKPDLVFPRLKKIIDVRGCFWHQHGKCSDSRIPKSRLDYWKPKLDRNTERDTANIAKLRRLGWRTLVVWGCECEAHQPDVLAQRLRRFLGAREKG